jgi:hypothetical protein
VLTFFMALLSFVDSTPRAYRLKASNAAPLFQHSPGQSATFTSKWYCTIAPRKIVTIKVWRTKTRGAPLKFAATKKARQTRQYQSDHLVAGAAGSHDQANQRAHDRTIRVGASGRREVRCPPHLSLVGWAAVIRLGVTGYQDHGTSLKTLCTTLVPTPSFLPILRMP